MPSLARKLIFDAANVGAYHCVARCVRRAFLCGVDRVSGRDFEHRREWLRRRLELLAGVFGLDVLGFAVMANHLHVVLRNRPDVVAAWSDDEVGRRWWRVCPLRREADGCPAEPTDADLGLILGDASRTAELRTRMSSISWFMRLLCEPLAKLANREDHCTGHFWEGRFKSQALLDDTALLACSVYVDLNPIRAGLAETPETSDFTSVKERIAALVAASKPAVSKQTVPEPPVAEPAASEPVASQRAAAQIESPAIREETAGAIASPLQNPAPLQTPLQTPPHSPPRSPETSPRPVPAASPDGWLSPVPLDKQPGWPREGGCAADDPASGGSASGGSASGGSELGRALRTAAFCPCRWPSICNSSTGPGGNCGAGNAARSPPTRRRSCSGWALTAMVGCGGSSRSAECSARRSAGRLR